MPIRAALAALAATLSLAAPALAGAPGKWTLVGQQNLDNIDEVSLVRTPDGVLHAVWTIPSNNNGSAGDSLAHAAISPGGVAGAPTTIQSGWATINNVPALVTTPDGLRAFFGGIRTTDASETNSNMNTATSSDGGATWSLFPGTVVKGDSAYGSDTGAATLPDGSPMLAFGGTGAGTFSHHGLDPTQPNYNLQEQFGGCCGYSPNVVVDSGGKPWVAWLSNATDHLGAFIQGLSATTGAPEATPSLMPGSTTKYNGRPETSQQLMRTPIVASPLPGGTVYMAYGGGYPTANKALLWKVGAPTSAVVGSSRYEHLVNLAAAPDGRIWVFWIERGGGRSVVIARRSNRDVTKFGPAVDAGTPAGQSTGYRVQGNAQAGALDILALFGGTGLLGQFHTQVLPGLGVTASPSKISRKKTTAVKFTVTDPDPVAGAKVSVGGKSATTDSKGHATIDLGPTGKKSFAVTVTKAGFAAGSSRVKTKK